GKLIASVGSEATPGAKEAEKYEATLRECPGGYLLSGRKAFASLAGGAQVREVFGREAGRLVVGAAPCAQGGEQGAGALDYLIRSRRMQYAPTSRGYHRAPPPQ
ncbi:MAG TPA: hypothetical protein VKF37_05040, partial [Chloroflexota bacterium]|nr:hypothetical protein [Chloroflexota bacterium]